MSRDVTGHVPSRSRPFAVPADGPGAILIEPPAGVKHDNEKPKFALIPLEALEDVARVLEFGMNRYGQDNWKKGIKTSRLFSAALRHLSAFQAGELVADDSGLSHIAHATTNLLFMMWMQQHRPELNDIGRPNETMQKSP